MIVVDADQKIPHCWIGSHGYACCGANQLLHRVLMEQWLNRPLLKKEHVHHINRNKLDNRKENLVLCKNNTEHKALHAKEDCERAGFDPEIYKWCSYHKKYELKETFGKHTSRCKEGTNEFRRGKSYSSFGIRGMMNQQYRRAIKKGICSSIYEAVNL